MASRINSNRGIQQEDVWSAADSLIADGLRPTIERVRQKIGRGSPNTVSPMLETWFATLASRLGVNKQDVETNNVPKALQKALNDAWEFALSKGRETASLEIVQAQDELTQATQAMNEREAGFVWMEQVSVVKHQALEQAVISSKSITDDALARLSEAQRLVNRFETEMRSLGDRLVIVETTRDSERLRNQEITTGHLVERQKIEERAQTSQHRLLEEIDRARQETKNVCREAETVRKQFAAEKILMEERIRIHLKEQLKVQALYTDQSAEIHALREAFAISNSRAHETQELLKAQLNDSKSAAARLTEAFLNRENEPNPAAKFLVSKFKRTRSIRKR